MESNKLKEISIKNRTCYYFNDFDFDTILIDEKACENILVSNISRKTLMSAKLLLLRFDKINGFIKVHDGNRYLVLFGGEEYDFI